jgi:hypothetical protein
VFREHRSDLGSFLFRTLYPTLCEYCEKGFYSKFALKIHMVTIVFTFLVLKAMQYVKICSTEYPQETMDRPGTDGYRNFGVSHKQQEQK